MKFSISSDRLKEALAKVSTVVPSKTTLPILQDILFELNGNTLTLTATDLEISVRMKLDPVDGEEDGAIAIPEDKLTSVVKALPEGLLLRFETLDSDRVVITTNKGGIYKISGADVDNFPQQNFDGKCDYEREWMIDEWEKMIRILLTGIARDNLRPALEGIYYREGNGKIEMVASDGYKLVYCATSKQGNYKAEFIMTKRFAQTSSKILRGVDVFTLKASQNFILIETDDIWLLGRVIDEKYPNWESIIPGYSGHIYLDREDLLGIITRLKTFAVKEVPRISFEYNFPKLIIKAKDENGNEGVEKIEVAEVENLSKFKFSINADYLMGILRQIDDSEKIRLNFADSNKPIKIDFWGENGWALIMPIKLEEEI